MGKDPLERTEDTGCLETSAFGTGEGEEVGRALGHGTAQPGHLWCPPPIDLG